MNEMKFEEMVRKPNGVYFVLKEMNNEMNRLIAFARNVNAFGGHKIDKGLASVDDETFEEYEAKKKQMKRGVDENLVVISEDKKK